MKNKIAILMVLLISITIVTAVTNLPPEWAKIVVTLVNQEPDPAEPGGFVDVRLKFENRGSKNAEDITVELIEKNPLSVYSDSAVQKIGSVHGRQIGDIGRIIKYRLKVDENAVEGENELKLRYKIGNSQWIELDPFTINIRSHDAILSIESIESQQIKPGGQTPVTIKIKNMADSLIKDIKLKLDLSNVPFAPIGSTNEKTITQLLSKKEATAIFDIMAEPDAESNIYKIPLRIDYSDELWNKYEINSTIGLIIGDKPDMSVIIDSTNIYSSGKKGDITIKFVNKGITDLKLLNLKLKQTNDFDIISSAEVYIGNVDSDDYETADFTLFIKKSKENEIKIPLNIEYKDANNKDYSEDIYLNLKLYSGSEAKKVGLIKGNSKIGIIIVLVIVVGGLFFYIKWKKKRKSKK